MRAKDILLGLKDELLRDKEDRMTHLVKIDDVVESAKLRGEIRYISSLYDQLLDKLNKGVD